MKKALLGYILLFAGIIGIDRMSKSIALTLDKGCHSINSSLAFAVVFNRGFSWSFFHSDATLIFFLVSVVIAAITFFLILYAITRYNAGYAVLGECLVIAGSVSNIIDRVWYGGVVDFIILSYKDWYWPAFNCADMAIVLGALIMLYYHYEK